jgi:hypothetical protein
MPPVSKQVCGGGENPLQTSNRLVSVLWLSSPLGAGVAISVALFPLIPTRTVVRQGGPYVRICILHHGSREAKCIAPQRLHKVCIYDWDRHKDNITCSECARIDNSEVVLTNDLH